MNTVNQRRTQIGDQLKNGEFLVLFSGQLAYESQDETYPFSVNRNFYYLTDLAIKHAILVIYQQQGNVQTHLFIERYDEWKAKWVGATMQSSEATAISGIASISYLDEFDDKMATWLFYDVQPAIYLDLQRENHSQSSDLSQAYAATIQQKYPQARICHVHQLMAGMRLKKTEEEVRRLQVAIGITNQGIQRMMECVEPGMMEYQLEAKFNYALQWEGCRKTSFKSIVAGSENATVLHYTENDCVLEDGSLVLCDLGATYQQYNADITRTFPVNGVFTDRQKELYNLVLEANEDVIAHAVVGTTLRTLNQRVIDLYAKRLPELGLLGDGDTVMDYYYHGVSHMLGLDTHDVTLRDYVLEEGNVITVEPGIYIAKEKIGIRIEDDILITKEGPVNLSSQIIKSVEDIETWMAKKELEK